MTNIPMTDVKTFLDATTVKDLLDTMTKVREDNKTNRDTAKDLAHTMTTLVSRIMDDPKGKELMHSVLDQSLFSMIKTGSPESVFTANLLLGIHVGVSLVLESQAAVKH